MLKDLDTLKEIARTCASIGFILTTTGNDLAAKIEPFASRPLERLTVLAGCRREGATVQAGIVLN